MTNNVSGKATLSLSKPDASGNVGYSLTYSYVYSSDSPEGTIEYANIEFSGPGNWDDYSEGDDYPFDQMLATVLSGSQKHD